MFSASGIMGGVNLSCVRLLRVLEFENLLFGLGIYHLYKNSNVNRLFCFNYRRIICFMHVTFKPEILYIDIAIVKEKLKDEQP
jgi:hypothetical protein